MGGFQLSIKDVHPSENTTGPWHRPISAPTHVVLSTHGVQQLAELGHFVTIADEKIANKSKASILQKALVITQVGWMAVQCSIRAAWGLPISLLELHTLAHAVVALSLYLFWLKVGIVFILISDRISVWRLTELRQKPVDIGDPEIVKPEPGGFVNAIALMVQEQFCTWQNQIIVLYPPQTPDSQNGNPALLAQIFPTATF